jgi:hypothetical protein
VYEIQTDFVRREVAKKKKRKKIQINAARTITNFKALLFQTKAQHMAVCVSICPAETIQHSAVANNGN